MAGINNSIVSMRDVKKIGHFDGYRTTAFFGFNVPLDTSHQRHFHVPCTPSKYVPLRRSNSLHDLFSSERGMTSGNRVSLIKEIKRRLKFEMEDGFASNVIEESSETEHVGEQTVNLQHPLRDDLLKEDKEVQTMERVDDECYNSGVNLSELIQLILERMIVASTFGNASGADSSTSMIPLSPFKQDLLNIIDKKLLELRAHNHETSTFYKRLQDFNFSNESPLTPPRAIRFSTSTVSGEGTSFARTPKPLTWSNIAFVPFDDDSTLSITHEADNLIIDLNSASDIEQHLSNRDTSATQNASNESQQTAINAKSLATDDIEIADPAKTEESEAVDSPYMSANESDDVDDSKVDPEVIQEANRKSSECDDVISMPVDDKADGDVENRNIDTETQELGDKIEEGLLKVDHEILVEDSSKIATHAEIETSKEHSSDAYQDHGNATLPLVIDGASEIVDEVTTSGVDEEFNAEEKESEDINSGDKINEVIDPIDDDQNFVSDPCEVEIANKYLEQHAETLVDLPSIEVAENNSEEVLQETVDEEHVKVQVDEESAMRSTEHKTNPIEVEEPFVDDEKEQNVSRSKELAESIENLEFHTSLTESGHRLSSSTPKSLSPCLNLKDSSKQEAVDGELIQSKPHMSRNLSTEMIQSLNESEGNIEVFHDSVTDLIDDNETIEVKAEDELLKPEMAEPPIANVSRPVTPKTSTEKLKRNYIAENILNVSGAKSKIQSNSSSIFCTGNPFATTSTPEIANGQKVKDVKLLQDENKKPKQQKGKKQKKLSPTKPKAARIAKSVKRYKRNCNDDYLMDIEKKLSEHCANQDDMNGRMEGNLERMNNDLRAISDMQEELIEIRETSKVEESENLRQDFSRLEAISLNLLEHED